MAEKAEIVVLKDGQDHKTIPVMYNPTEYTIGVEATVEGEGANVQFTKTNLSDISINLFFDTYEQKEDVRTKVKDIMALVVPGDGGVDSKKPYICKFIWGKTVYKGVITKVDTKYTMFLSTGIPVRAELTATVKSVLSPVEYAKQTGQSDSRKFWNIKSSDRLDLIAKQMLGDETLWRVIAKANSITDVISFPTEDQVGRVLMIPDYYHSRSN